DPFVHSVLAWAIIVGRSATSPPKRKSPLHSPGARPVIWVTWSVASLGVALFLLCCPATVLFPEMLEKKLSTFCFSGGTGAACPAMVIQKLSQPLAHGALACTSE